MSEFNLGYRDCQVIDRHSLPLRAEKHYSEHTISEVRSLLDQLPQTDERILVLFYSGNSQPEIANALQKRQSTVSHRIKSSLKTLKLLSRIPKIHYSIFFHDVKYLIPADLIRILCLVSANKSFSATARQLNCSPFTVRYYFVKALLMLQVVSKFRPDLSEYTRHFLFIRSHIRHLSRLHR